MSQAADHYIVENPHIYICIALETIMRKTQCLKLPVIPIDLRSNMLQYSFIDGYRFSFSIVTLYTLSSTRNPLLHSPFRCPNLHCRRQGAI